VTPEEQAALDAAQEKQLRELAAQITQMSKLGFDPMTIRKGTVVAVADATTPPTVSLNISGSEDVLITEVRTLNNYTPLVGQTVLIAKQGSEIFILGAIASINPKLTSATNTSDNGWIKADLSRGTHGGGANDVYYRRVLDHGSWKMQWRGVWNVSGTAMLDAGTLDPDYRPAAFRPIIVTRNSDGSVFLRMDFNADGGVNYVAGTPRINTTGDLGGTAVSVGNHSHGIDWDGDADGGGADHNHFGTTWGAGGHSHSLDTGSHSHGGFVDIGDPTWISLNGVEYFL
jgi:hypothetical protein